MQYVEITSKECDPVVYPSVGIVTHTLVIDLTRKLILTIIY